MGQLGVAGIITFFLLYLKSFVLVLGVVKFDVETGKQFKTKSPTLSYTQYFAEALIKEAEVDNKVVAIHAAMGGGTGLNYFQKKFPDRCFDVGIAEQHAVTFAAGLATEGLKPFCAIYSSFLQRGYDQVSTLFSLSLDWTHDTVCHLSSDIYPTFLDGTDAKVCPV